MTPAPKAAPRERGAVLITGAGSGIGRALALDLAGRGTTVIATVRTAGDAPRPPAGGGRIHEIVLDVTEPVDLVRLPQDVRAALGTETLRAVVNNAGMGVGGPLEFVRLEDLRRQFEVNVVGQVAVTQAVLELLRENGSSRVVL